MARTRHPKKEVEEAIQHAEANGWRIQIGGSHAWGKMYCPTTMRSAAAVNSVSRAFGVRRRIPAIMLGSFGVSSTTAQPVNGLQRPRSPSLNLNRSE
jgi:hypothetical protein